MEFKRLINVQIKIVKNVGFLALKLSQMLYLSAHNVKMPTIICILTFMSMMLYSVELSMKKVYNLLA